MESQKSVFSKNTKRNKMSSLFSATSPMPEMMSKQTGGNQEQQKDQSELFNNPLVGGAKKKPESKKLRNGKLSSFFSHPIYLFYSCPIIDCFFSAKKTKGQARNL